MESTLAAGSVEDLFAALNRRDYDSVSAFFADEVTLAGAEPTVLRGLQAVIEHFQQSDALLPDSSLALGDVLTGEAKLGVEFVLRGTQSGDLNLGAERGIAPASGRSAAVPAFWSMSVSEGKIVGITHYWDMYAMLSQLGLLPVMRPGESFDSTVGSHQRSPNA